MIQSSEILWVGLHRVKGLWVAAAKIEYDCNDKSSCCYRIWSQRLLASLHFNQNHASTTWNFFSCNPWDLFSISGEVEKAKKFSFLVLTQTNFSFLFQAFWWSWSWLRLNLSRHKALETLWRYSSICFYIWNWFTHRSRYKQSQWEFL